MTTTLVLQVVDEIGTASWPATRHQRARFDAQPAESFDTWQPGYLPITARHLEHGGLIVGAVEYLEQGIDNPDVTAVGILDGDLAEAFRYGQPVYCSAEVTGHYAAHSAVAQRSELHALALVAATAGVGARPIRAYDGDFRDPNSQARTRGDCHRLLERAAAAARKRWDFRRPHRLQVHRPVADYEMRSSAGRPTNIGPIHYSHPYPGVLAVR